MRPRAIVEAQMPADRGPGFGDAVVVAQADLLVFHRPPEPFDEDVVAPGALAVHADGDLGPLQHRDEVGAGELRTLIAVEDLGRAVAVERLLQRLDAEVRREGDRQPPGQDLAAEPVDDGDQTDEAARPSACNRPFSIRLPANGNSMCSLSIRCISFRSASDTGRGL